MAYIKDEPYTAEALEKAAATLAEVTQALGCHPGMLMAELAQVIERAERVPTADEHHQLQAALAAAVTKRNDDVEALTEQRDAVSAKLDAAQMALAAVTAERDRMREAPARLADVCPCSNGCDPADMTCAQNVARAALLATCKCGAEHDVPAALATPPAPASMPLAEVEAYGMRVAEAVREAARLRCLQVGRAFIGRMSPLEPYGCADMSRFAACDRDTLDVDLAAVVKGVK